MDAILLRCIIVLSMMPCLESKVLIVHFDGFRWDYTNINGLVNFKRMAKEGVTVPYMNVTVSSTSYSSTYSIATGLFSETHGILLNSMYDPQSGAYFNRGSSTKPETNWLVGSEPFWITASRDGLKSGVLGWVFSEDEINGHTATFSIPNDNTYPWENKTRDVIEWFKEEEVDIVALYDNNPDAAGHRYGPFSLQTNASVRQTDSNLGYLLQKLNESDLLDDMNIIVTSDHGMTTVSLEDTIGLLDYISDDMFEVLIPTGAICMILPKEGMKETIYENLKGKHEHMEVYYKEDLPERWHYTDNPRVLPIVVAMDLGWRCADNKTALPPIIRGMVGGHGYDYELMEMKSIFFAMGPAFKEDFVGTPISSVDIYGLVCGLLDVEPAPNNGSDARLAQFLKQDETKDSDSGSGSGDGLQGHKVLIVFALLSLMAQSHRERNCED